MTSIRLKGEQRTEPDEPAVKRHLPSGRLRPRRRILLTSLWMVPAAGALAALLVLELDTFLDRAETPAAVEAPVKKSPSTTGSVSQVPATETPSSASVEVQRPRHSQPLPPPAALSVMPPIQAPGPSAELHLRPSLAPARPASETRIEPPRPTLVLSPEEVATHLARGEERLRAGDLAAARLYFERVALSGDQRGALGMARTYDPAVLAGLPILGPRGDPAAARHWYQRAGTQRAGG